MNSEIYIFNLLSKEKEAAIREMIKALEIEREEEAFADVMKREELSSTLVSPLIAIPHAKSSAVNRLSYVVARSLDGVSWNDGKAKIVILTLSPVTASGEHVIFLSHVARLLSDEGNVERIMNADTPCEMEEVFRDYVT